jgi:hypothetical protein
VGTGVVALFTIVLWGTAHIQRERLNTIKALIHLSLLILLFCWFGTRFRMHMSDLVFSIVMLTTFSGTFVFNGFYVRRQTVKAWKTLERSHLKHSSEP